MKTRASLLVVGFTALALAAVVVWRNTAKRSPAPDAGRRSSTQAAPAPAAKSRNVVAIEDGNTIDFSLGVPIVRDSEKEKALLARAVREMEEASLGVTFESPTTSPAPPAAAKR